MPLSFAMATIYACWRHVLLSHCIASLVLSLLFIYFHILLLQAADFIFAPPPCFDATAESRFSIIAAFTFIKITVYAFIRHFLLNAVISLWLRCLHMLLAFRYFCSVSILRLVIASFFTLPDSSLLTINTVFFFTIDHLRCLHSSLLFHFCSSDADWLLRLLLHGDWLFRLHWLTVTDCFTACQSFDFRFYCCITGFDAITS